MPYEKVSLKGKIKSKFNSGKLAVGAAYKMTSARKAALMKAVKASALARRKKMGLSNTDVLRAQMKVKSKVNTAVQTAKAKTIGKVNKGKKAVVKSAKAKFAKAGGNTALLRAQMKVKSTAKKAKAGVRTAKAITKGKGVVGGAKALLQVKKNVSANRKAQAKKKYGGRGKVNEKKNARNLNRYMNRGM